MNKIKLHSLVAFAVEATLKREDLSDLIAGAKTDLGDFLTLRAEAVNFASPDWLPFGRNAAACYRKHRRTPVFSVERLLYRLAVEHLLVLHLPRGLMLNAASQ